MAIFGGKKNDNDNESVDQELDLDALIEQAIEETDAEQEALKEEKRKAHEEMLIKQREEAVAQEKARADALKANGGRRFYLIAESSEVGEDSITTTGDLYGEMHKGDKVFVYRPGGSIIMSEVMDIKSADDSQKADDGEVNGAKNAKVSVTMKFKFKNVGVVAEKLIPKFTVISGIKPMNNPKGPIENPALLGVSLKYTDNADNKEYLQILMGHMTLSRFIIPAHVGEEGPDGKKKLQIIAINKKDGDGRMLPIFTDPAALSAWKELMQNEQKPTAVVVTFPEAVNMSKQDGVDLILNPYGPVAIQFPAGIIDTISKSKGYIDRFGEDGKKKPSYSKEMIKDANRIMVGEPPAIAEVKAVREAIKEYAATVSDITSVGLLAKKNSGEEPGYLVIVDCPKGVEREIFKDIYAAMKPLLNKFKKVEFSRYAETMFADDYFSLHPLDYVKNPNI